MTRDFPHRPSFWATVRLLLGVTRKRAAGRRRRQQELLHNRTGRTPTFGSGFGFAISLFFMAVLNVGAAFVLLMAVDTAQRVEIERQGKIVVSHWFQDLALSEALGESSGVFDRFLPLSDYSTEAKHIVDRYGGTQADVERRLRQAVRQHGARDLITKEEAFPGRSAFSKPGPLATMVGSVVLIWWVIMLVFQGEGLELDLQRRRHPMWEWLFTHPAHPGAIFLAEMLSPIAANPTYWGAPLFVGFAYGFVYGPITGILAMLLIGIPITTAAACTGKALEIGATLRFSTRSRGALIGLMSWLGYASMMLFFVGLFAVSKIVTAAGGLLYPLAALPWPWLGLFLGKLPNGIFLFPYGMLLCWLAAAVATAGAIGFSVWGAQQGLSGNFAAADMGPAAARNGGTRLGRPPLYRKEFLWFIRDRSAIVQTILIPLTVASFQVFNLRGILSHAQGAWNYLSGAAILFGTYFLWILGPKSLSSEGSALWIALTWPRGMESLLKAKAWLWSLISSAIVALVLCYAAYLFPDSIWKIMLVGVGWFFFGRSMAEKTVTLVRVTSASGEQEPIPRGRRWGAQLGMLTFSIGIMTEQWHIAVMGIVYSYVTAAAMWQSFRAHLPYLYDPWSEKVPPPPTLMHAMIAISILVEGGAVVTGVIVALAGKENIAVAQTISYGICAVIVSIGVSNFLTERDVLPGEVWCWEPAGENDGKSWWRGNTPMDRFLGWLVMGAAGGLGLGVVAHGYLAVLGHLPATAEIIRRSQEAMAKIPNLKVSYTVMAVGFAPFAEEYLFRGLLFRALDREWGGWRAVLGSAAFFAIYHPPLAWLPVGLVGIANAVLFKKTGRLAPAVVLHMVYNIVVSM